MLNDMMDRAGGTRRILIGAVGLGTAVLIMFVSRVATAPTWVPAMTNVPLQSASGLADKLDQAGIKYKLDQGGSTIMVAEADVAKARVALAKDGLPNGARPGLELFDRPTWGWNDFTQRVNYRRALEGELERTISGMRGIDHAEVHLALSDQPAFRRADERPTTASVVLALKQGGEPSEQVVDGIAHLVSASVDGLAPENVSIHDDAGRLWSEPNDGGSAAGLSDHELRVQEGVEKYMEHKAEDLISEMVGPNNAHVRVSASINFDKVERTTQAIDPDKQALATEQKSEITPGQQGGAASSNIANSYENTKSTETFSGAIGNVKRVTVAVLVNDKRLPSSGKGDTVPHFQTRSPEELARIEMLVRSALGVDSTRGDAVSVVSVPFDTPKLTVPAATAPVDFSTRVEVYERPAVTGVALLLAFALALLTMRALKSRGASTLALPSAIAMSGANMLPAGPPAAAPMPAPSTAMVPAPRAIPAAPKFVFPEANTEIRDKVVSTVSTNPDSAARLVKSWIKDG
jgi:flagellar M-ring protein FliF